MFLQRVVHTMATWSEWSRDNHIMEAYLMNAYVTGHRSTVWLKPLDRGAPGRLVGATIKLVDEREATFVLPGI